MKIEGLGNTAVKRLRIAQSNFERNAKKILGFERFLSQIRDIEKNCLLIKREFVSTQFLSELHDLFDENNPISNSFSGIDKEYWLIDWLKRNLQLQWVKTKNWIEYDKSVLQYKSYKDKFNLVVSNSLFFNN